MKITLRQRKKGNKITLYLDYYDQGKREYEHLGLYLTPEPDKGSLTKAQKDENKKILELAESIRSKRHLEVQNSIYGFRDKEKLKGSFFEFFDALVMTGWLAGDGFQCSHPSGMCYPGGYLYHRRVPTHPASVRDLLRFCVAGSVMLFHKISRG